MILRLLLVDNGLEDVTFLRDVLTEIEVGRFWDSWVHIETLHAPTLQDACALLANEPVDSILLDPDLPDLQGIETFRRVQCAAPQTPVLVLIAAADSSL